MLYISGLGYKEINGTQEPIYTIKYATSKNIVSWFRQSNPLIELKDDEGSPICFSHPTFIKINSKEWLVLSCSRGINDYRYGKQGYNLVYWVTKNLTTLEGIKEIDIKHNLSTIEAKKYHQSMQAYPSLFWLNQKLYCTFNGNRFGRTGFGIARVNIKTKNE